MSGRDLYYRLNPTAHPNAWDAHDPDVRARYDAEALRSAVEGQATSTKPPARVPTPGTFYILSLKWTKRSDHIITWWAPKSNGYRYRIEEAGEYTAEEIANRHNYLNDGESTMSIPVEAVTPLLVRVGDTPTMALDWNREQDNHVVPWSVLRNLKKVYGPKRAKKAKVAQ